MKLVSILTLVMQFYLSQTSAGFQFFHSFSTYLIYPVRSNRLCNFWFSLVTEETNKSLILNTEVVCKTLADLLRQFGLTMGANIVKKIISV